MNNNTEIIHQVTQAVQEKTGMVISLKLKKAKNPHIYKLGFKRKEILFWVELKHTVPAYKVEEIAKQESEDLPLMVVAEQIVPAARMQLREKGIAYMEANGNMFIDTDQAVIFVDGNKPVKEMKPVANRAFTKTGLKAVFHFLNDPAAITRKYRQLAEETGMALGNIKYIMDGLNEAGFILPINKREVALKNRRALLERWIAGYRETLKPDLFKARFRIVSNQKREEWKNINVKALDLQWGGEAAGELLTNYLTAHELTLYSQVFPIKQGNTIGLIPDKSGDVYLYEKFWFEYGEVKVTAPALLVYADLLITDDPRCIETAQIIYETYLKSQIEAD